MKDFYLRDCIEGMKDFPDKFFDLAIVDPPYGIGEDAHKTDSRARYSIKSKEYKPFAGNDKEPPGPEYFEELFRVSKNQIIFGGNYFIDKIKKPSSCWIVWDKDNGGSDYADCELAWTSFPGAIRKFRYRWAGMIQENMKEKEFRIHPTQKPVALYKWILTKWGGTSGIILDTHVGSASSLIACEELGFDYVGFELSPHYYELAKKRLQQEAAQLTLFNYRKESNP